MLGIAANLLILYAETAINIGYSSILLVEDMRVFIINAEDKGAVKKQLTDAKYVNILQDLSSIVLSLCHAIMCIKI